MSYELFRQLEAEFKREREARIFRLVRWSIRMLFLGSALGFVMMLDVVGVVMMLILLIIVEIFADRLELL